MTDILTQYSVILPEKVDATRHELAFGRQGIPKLINEGLQNNLYLQQRSVVALSQLLHDSNNIASSLDAGILPMLNGLLTGSVGDITIRQKSIDCLYLLSTSQLGRSVIVSSPILDSVCPVEVREDSDPYVRLKTHTLLANLTSIPEGAQAVINRNILPDFCNFLFKKEELLEVKKAMLKTLYQFLRYGQSPCVPEQVTDLKVLDSLLSLIEPTSITAIKELALQCIMALCFHESVRHEMCDMLRLRAVTGLLNDWKSQVRAAAAGALMALTIDVSAKQILVQDLFVPKLVDLLNDDNTIVQLNVLKTLTNCAEDYRGRFQLRTSLAQIEALKASSDANVAEAARNAVKVITWCP